MQNEQTLTMKERQDPKFIQFSTGDVVEGMLVGIERVLIKGKSGVRYTVQEDGGALVAFIGTYQLNTKLRIDDKGHRVDIRCVGEDVTVKRGDNCMKVFEVRVSDERVKAATAITDGTEITDEDIPF